MRTLGYTVSDQRKTISTYYVKQNGNLFFRRGWDLQWSGRGMKQALTVCSSLHLPGRAQCTVAMAGSYSPGDLDLSKLPPPLISLCCIRETPHAPCINAVIQNQHVKSEFGCKQSERSLACRSWVFILNGEEARWPRGTLGLGWR